MDFQSFVETSSVFEEESLGSTSKNDSPIQFKYMSQNGKNVISSIELNFEQELITQSQPPPPTIKADSKTSIQKLMEKYQAKYLQEKNTNTDSSLVVDK